MAGITSGGAWLVERLHQDLNLRGKPGVLSSSLHRDDLCPARQWLPAPRLQIAFDANGADVLVLDDVLLHQPPCVSRAQRTPHDYGRPASVRLACSGGPGGRKLPSGRLCRSARWRAG